MIDIAKIAPQAYLILILSIGTMLSPPPYSIAALFLLALQIYSIYKSPRTRLNLNLAITFSTLILAPLTLEPIAGKIFPAILIVPAIPLLDKALRENALKLKQPFNHLNNGRGATATATATAKILTIALLLTFISAVTLLNQTLMITSVVLAAYLTSISLYILIKIPKKPLIESKTWCRVIVGESIKTSTAIKSEANTQLNITLKPLYDWVQLHPSKFTLSVKGGGEVKVNLNVKPPLAGPSKIQLQALAIDIWGLIQTEQTLEPVELHIIPRARYAEWLARKFLEVTAPGIGAMAEVPPLRAFTTGRLGLEYYGSRPYQPGDRLRDLDWKHTLKFRELIVKEYTGAQGQPAIIAANLVATDPEEADKLTYALITSALTLAIEGLQTAITAYNEREVIESTSPISSREALKRALKLTQKIKIIKLPKRVLEPPNAMKLRRSIEQLKMLKSEPARRLAEILSFEQEALEEAARNHQASKAIEKVAEICPPPATIAWISLWNHDAEVLPTMLERMEKRGYAVVPIEVAAEP
jgi:uncharacterized protein (DUF58 family)